MSAKPFRYRSQIFVHHGHKYRIYDCLHCPQCGSRILFVAGVGIEIDEKHAGNEVVFFCVRCRLPFITRHKMCPRCNKIHLHSVVPSEALREILTR